MLFIVVDEKWDSTHAILQATITGVKLVSYWAQSYSGLSIFSFKAQTLQSSTSSVSKSPLVSSFITSCRSFLYSEKKVKATG